MYAWRRVSAFFRREPLAGFALGGGLLFVILAPYLPYGKEVIEVDARMLAAVLEGAKNARGRELTAEERGLVIDDYVNEEVLLRESYRKRWHLQDEQLRLQLAMTMRSAMNEVLPEPTAEELRAYFKEHAERYRIAETVAFSHVFFELMPPRPSLVRELLAGGEDFRRMGDRFAQGSTLRQTHEQLTGALGESFADSVFALGTGVWSDPISSSRGVHFVRVDARFPSERPAYESVQRFVRADWNTDRRREIHAREMSRIREQAEEVEDLTEEELLVREVFRSGLDRVDPGVRATIVAHARKQLLQLGGIEENGDDVRGEDTRETEDVVVERELQRIRRRYRIEIQGEAGRGKQVPYVCSRLSVTESENSGFAGILGDRREGC